MRSSTAQMYYIKMFDELTEIERCIYNEIDDDLQNEYSRIFRRKTENLSFTELVDRYAQILYFWSNYLPDFSDIENGRLEATTRWLYIHNKLIQAIRRIKRLDKNILKYVLDRYILISLNS